MAAGFVQGSKKRQHQAPKYVPKCNPKANWGGKYQFESSAGLIREGIYKFLSHLRWDKEMIIFFGVFFVFLCFGGGVFVLLGFFFVCFSRVSANFFLGLFFSRWRKQSREFLLWN